jgi:WD40 repeat protein
VDEAQSKVFCIAFSPDSRTLALGGADRAIKLWNIAGAGSSSSSSD